MTIRKLLVALAGLILAFAGLAARGPLSAFAGYGSSAVCGDGDNDVNIISSPVEIGLEVGELNTLGAKQPGYIALCYSTTPNGFQGGETTGGAIYAQLPVLPNASEFQGQHTAGFGCVPDANPQFVATSCWFATDPSVTTSGDTVSAAIPFGICAGVGGSTPPPQGECVGEAPGLGTTGLVFGTFSPTGPPAGTDTGAGVSVGGTTLYLDGIGFGIPGGGAASAGIGSHSVAVGPGTSGAPVCAANGLVCEPAPSFIAALTGTQDFVAVSADGTTEAVGSPVGHYCIIDINSTTC